MLSERLQPIVRLIIYNLLRPSSPSLVHQNTAYQASKARVRHRLPAKSAMIFARDALPERRKLGDWTGLKSQQTGSSQIFAMSPQCRKKAYLGSGVKTSSTRHDSFASKICTGKTTYQALIYLGSTNDGHPRHDPRIVMGKPPRTISAQHMLQMCHTLSPATTDWLQVDPAEIDPLEE